MNASGTKARRIWLDGELVPWDAAQVHVLSHSMARGSLVFDYLSVHETARGTALFRLDEHVERFLRSCKLVGLPLLQDFDVVRRACFAAARANPGAKVLKLNAFVASVEVDVVPYNTRVSLAVAAFDPANELAHAPRKETLKLWLEKERRQRRPDILHPHAKVAANYTSPMLAKWRARVRGFDDILLLDEEGFVTEGPTTNFFLVNAEGALCTPPEAGVLLGVTRRSVLELARAEKLETREVRVRPEDIARAREAFITGTSAGVAPVAEVDGAAIGARCPGPVSQRLRARFERAAAGDDPDFAHWLSFVD